MRNVIMKSMHLYGLALAGLLSLTACATPGDTLAPGQSCRVAEIHSTLLIVEPVLTETARRAAH